MAEALAVVMLLRDTPSLLVGHAATFDIDNLSALSGFVMGYSQIADMSGIYMAVAARAAQLSMPARFEHVPSNSNIADGRSKQGVTDPVAKAAGFALSEGAWAAAWPNLHQYSLASRRAWRD